jgi:thiosulfate/3-mercaptopyruvate sulfurtransferase
MAELMNDPMVSTAWLGDRLDDASVRILDASWFMPGSTRNADAEYAAGHIPGAVRFDIDGIADRASDLPHMLPSPSEFGVAMRRLGLEPGSTVVVYDSEGLFSAPRAWWSLRAMGHVNCLVLDGGLPRWVGEGRPLEIGWREPSHGEFRARLVPSLVETLDGVLGSLETGAAQILDARPAARFTGEAPEPRPGLRGGHMPGAINVPWTNLAEGGRLLPTEQLRAMFLAAGVDPTAPIVTSCGSGVSACVIALALARLGRVDVAVYDGSWSEWGARDDTPIVTGA